ncbi:MAG: hypothetical protein AAF770_01515 [Bacteroidota bacterium]
MRNLYVHEQGKLNQANKTVKTLYNRIYYSSYTDLLGVPDLTGTQDGGCFQRHETRLGTQGLLHCNYADNRLYSFSIIKKQNNKIVVDKTLGHISGTDYMLMVDNNQAMTLRNQGDCMVHLFQARGDEQKFLLTVFDIERERVIIRDLAELLSPKIAKLIVDPCQTNFYLTFQEDQYFLFIYKPCVQGKNGAREVKYLHSLQLICALERLGTGDQK